MDEFITSCNNNCLLPNQTISSFVHFKAVKIRHQRVPVKKESVSDGEGDLKDGVESAGESYNDPNDDDYLPDSECVHHYCYVTFKCLRLGGYKNSI